MDVEKINDQQAEATTEAIVNSPGNLSWHDLVLARVRLLAQRRISWLRNTWGRDKDNISGRTVLSYHDEIDGYLENLDSPFAETEWINTNKEVELLNIELIRVEKLLSEDTESRLSQLVSIFGLNAVEADMVQACLAILMDPNLSKVFAYLQDNNHRYYVTTALVSRLFRHENFLLISNSSPLVSWGLLVETHEPGMDTSGWELDPVICNWLMHVTDIDPMLANIAAIQIAEKPLQSWPVEQTVNYIRELFAKDADAGIRILISGSSGSGRKNFAAGICWNLSLFALQVKADRISEQNWQQVYMRVQRQAYLNRMAPIWGGDSVFERYWPAQFDSFRIQFVIGEENDKLFPAENLVDYRVELPMLPIDECRDLIEKYLPASMQWDDVELTQLISSQEINIGQIRAMSTKNLLTMQEMSTELRAASAIRLGSLAHPIPSSFRWNDLVLPGWLMPILDDFRAEANERARLWDNEDVKRLFPQGRGLMALFTGAPGTGKTMAAQVIANSLKMDLFRIDLSTVISKYVGETSKNIERILARAKRMGVLLLFDEADALFGKRTEIKDAHDRFANTDTNYLLQAIEEYPGICILTSNRKMNIDSGFLRRIRYIIDFPKPDAKHRLSLWQTLLEEMAGEENAVMLHDDVAQLANLIELTGAQIKLTILSAMFMVRHDRSKLRTRHLLRALERELIKEGRGLGRHIHETFKGALHDANR